MVPQSTWKTEQQNHKIEAIAVGFREFGEKASDTVRVRGWTRAPFIGSYQTHLISPSLGIRGIRPNENQGFLW